MTSDPSALWGTIGTVVGALLALLTAFGVPLTETQEEAILRLFAVLGPLVVALAIRRRAWRPSSVRELVELAVDGEFVPPSTPEAHGG